MATGTRSKVKDIKTSTLSGSTASDGIKSRASNSISKDIKSSTTSGSSATDSSTLRRSNRDTSAKKMGTSSRSFRKSKRHEGQTVSSLLEKKQYGVVEKKRPLSPLRRSERLEKYGASCSSGSKKSNSSSSPLKKKKKQDTGSGKMAVADNREQGRDRNLEIKNHGSLKQKKRMNARAYRALFRKAKSSDADNNHPKEDSASQGYSCHSGDGNPVVQEGGDECNGRKEENHHGKHSDDDGKEAVEGSSSGSRELAELNLGHDGQRNSARVSKKRKYEDISPVSKCSGSSLPSSPVKLTAKENGGVTVEREVDDERDRLDARELDREELGTLELAASTSEERSTAVDIYPDRGSDFEASKSEKMAAGLDPNISVTLLDKSIHNPEASLADATSLLSSNTRSESMEQCVVCSQPYRVHYDLRAQDVCSCNAPRTHDFVVSNSEEACEPVAPLGNSREGEVVATTSQISKVQRFLVSETRGQSSGSEGQKCLLASDRPEHVSVPMAEDRGRPVDDSTSIAEEHLSSSHPKESFVAIRTDSARNACVVCKHPGLLLCCDGNCCKRSYHLPCLDPPLQGIPPGIWLCHLCVKKKVESGVYSVSEGIESVWDVKEGMQNEKHYFVKYKGLAHVHNRWVPESQMLVEAPMLVAKFNRRYQKEKVTRWKVEWTQPHRLLQKRLLIPQSLADKYFGEHGNEFSYCYHEWFVKWKGLGYEYATWEFENSPFLSSDEARMLLEDYKRRQEEGKKAADPLKAEKSLQVRKNPFHKLTKLPDGCPAGLDNDHLISINRLREFWHKSQNAVFIDDQERIMKTILFISALQSHTCRPFLIISSQTSLSLWENDFMHFAPSINVVVYNGNKDVRKLIRTLEFYGEGGCIMFQVLLSHPDAIIEDFEVVDCISWEAVIVDDCQQSRVSRHLEQFKNLSTDFRLLLLGGQLKDKLSEYLNLLSFLDLGGKEHGVNNLKFGSNNTGSLAILKERLAHYIAYERKTDSSKFLEYWVPVQLSNVQLEQYCATLVSNSIALRSCSKIDHVGALRDILISTRKCCDHPYLLDQMLQGSLTKGVTPDKILDIGIKASGKLLLLDKILPEIKNQGLRVLILFQQSIGGAGRNSIGDILEDFLRQRFGADSYERVDSGLIMSKKLAALNMFNEKARGRFVFLLENRACLPSIKLSSVDAVIIFDSDWNPLNDLRALQRTSIESQFEQIKIFRLYSSRTVEEKVLIFAKQDMLLESNIQNISPSISHSLLSWGALHLFGELDEFHSHDHPINHSEISNDKLFLNDFVMEFLNDVVLEFLKQLPKNAETNNTGNCSILVKAQQSGTAYSRNISLVGEKEGTSSVDKDPPSFWSNLLEKRYPKWRYISEPSQRIRRKVQHLEGSLKGLEVENDEVKKKRRKVAGNTVDPISLQTWLHDKTKAAIKEKDTRVPDNLPAPCASNSLVTVLAHEMSAIPSNLSKEREADVTQAKVGSPYVPNSAGVVNNVLLNQYGSSMHDCTSELHKSHMADSDGREKLCNAQRSLHLLLKPELSRLCDTLKLPEDVKDMADRFLEYVMNNHIVSRESETILQAFLISLCWRAASFLKYRVDHKECLALSKKYLNFACNEVQADSVYSKLRMLKKIFSQTSASRNENESCSLDNKSSASIKVDDARDQMCGEGSKSAKSGFPKLGDIREVPTCSMSSGLPSLVQGRAAVLENQVEIRESPNDSMPSEGLSLVQGQAVVLVTQAEFRENPNGGIPSEQLSLVEEVAPVLETLAETREASNCNMPSRQLSLVQELAPQPEVQAEIRENNCIMPSERLSSVQEQTLPETQADITEIREQSFAHATQAEIRETPNGSVLSEQPSLVQEQDPASEATSEIQQDLGSLKDELIKKRIDLIYKICSRREYELLQKQQVEVSDFNVQKEEEKMKLKGAHDLDLDLIRSVHIDHIVRNDKIKLLNQELSKKITEFDQHMKRQRKKLAVMQVDARNKEREIRDQWLKEAKAGTLAESFDSLPLPESGFRLEEFNVSKNVEACDGSRNTISVAKSASECTDMITRGVGKLTKSTVEHLEIPSNIPNGRVEVVAEGMKTPVSLSNSMSQVEPIEPNGTSTVIGKGSLPGTARYMSEETETPSSQSDELNAAGDGLDAMPIASTTEKTVDSVPHECENNSHDTCFVSSPQSDRADCHALAHAFINCDSENCVPSNQVSSFREYERSALSVADGSKEGLSSPREDAISASETATTEVEAPIHNTSFSESNLLQFPPSIDTSSVENCQGSTPAVLGSEEEPCTSGTLCCSQQTEVSRQQPIVAAAKQVENRQGCMLAPLGNEEDPCIRGTHSVPHTEVPMQQPFVAAAVEAEQSNQLASGSVVHPCETRHCEEESSAEGANCSTQQPEVSMHQPIVAAAMPAEQSNQLGSQSLVQQSLLPHADMLSERIHTEEEPCIHSTHCSTQHVEVSMQQPILVADVQSERPSQFVSQSIVCPSPRCATMPLGRTCSEQESFTHATSSTQVTEAIIQQPIVASAVQAEQFNQLILQSVVHPIMPPERTRSEDLRNTNTQTEPGSRLLQIFRMLPLLPPQGLHPDPLQNELLRICKQEELCTKLFEDKKVQLNFECDQEIERVKRKFDALRQEAETIFIQDKKIFETTKSKIQMNIALADEFRAKFFVNKGGSSTSYQGHCSSSSVQQFHQALQPAPTLRPLSATPLVLASTPAALSPAATPARLRAPVPVATSPFGPVVRSTSIFPGTQVRSHFGPVLPTRVNLQVGSEPRAPAPHLHRFRPQTSLPAPSHLLQTGQMPSSQLFVPNAGPATSLSTPVVPISHVHPSTFPVAGTCLPIAPVCLPVCRGASLPSVELARGVGDSIAGTDPLNLSQFTEVDPSLDGWLSSNLPLMGNDLGSSSMAAARPTAAADVVCLSDDD